MSRKRERETAIMDVDILAWRDRESHRHRQ